MTTTRRGWRAALDSPLLRTVVVCGSLSVLLSATSAASVEAGQDMAVASATSAAGCVAGRPGVKVVDKGSQETCIAEAITVALRVSDPSSALQFEAIAPDSADDDKVLDDHRLERSTPLAAAIGVDTRHLTRLGAAPSLSLESEGHSLRAPPR